MKSNAKLKSNNFENCKLNNMYTNINCMSNKIAYTREFYNFNKNKPNIIILTEINAYNFKYPIIDTKLYIPGYNMFHKNLSQTGIED